MSTRISSALALLLLAACGREAAEASAADAGLGGGDAIECALAGAAEFRPGCAVQRVSTADGLQLAVRHPHGGFRRFDVLTDGRGLATADGAEPARISLREGGIGVTVGQDRYRLPATIADAGR